MLAVICTCTYTGASRQDKLLEVLANHLTLAMTAVHNSSGLGLICTHTTTRTAIITLVVSQVCVNWYAADYLMSLYKQTVFLGARCRWTDIYISRPLLWYSHYILGTVCLQRCHCERAKSSYTGARSSWTDIYFETVVMVLMYTYLIARCYCGRPKSSYSA